MIVRCCFHFISVVVEWCSSHSEKAGNPLIWENRWFYPFFGAKEKNWKAHQLRGTLFWFFVHHFYAPTTDLFGVEVGVGRWLQFGWCSNAFATLICSYLLYHTQGQWCGLTHDHLHLSWFIVFFNWSHPTNKLSKQALQFMPCSFLSINGFTNAAAAAPINLPLDRK